MGWPVMHSRSPALQNYFFRQYSLAGTYVPLAVPPDRLDAALRALAPLGFSGCNLTIPHKERALAIVDEVDAVARCIGAISCVVVRPDGTLWGTYVPLAVQPDRLDAARRALAPLGFSGCNLTIPHKERALAIVDEVDAVARCIGAISCVVVRPDGTLWGTNNDVHGFARNIPQQDRKSTRLHSSHVSES